MLTSAEMKCKECGSDATGLEATVDRGGSVVRFRVDCADCGAFSHHLEHSELNRAVQRLLSQAPFVAVWAPSDQGPLILKASEFAKQYPSLVKRVDRMLVGQVACLEPENLYVFKLLWK